MRVVIAAGGTGGHFYPGLAVARALLDAKDDVSFIIKKGDYVRPLLEREKISYAAISAGGFNRKLDPRNVLVVFKLMAGFFQAFKILSASRPDALLVMGGYLSVPPAFAARLLGIPVVLHEQNVVPGLANRLLSHLAQKVAVSFPGSEAAFGNKAILVGNPVRKEFTSLPSQSESRKKWGLDPSKLTVFIFGGSLGARRLNELVVEAFEAQSQFAATFQVIHITGPNDVTWVRPRYEKLPFKFYVDSYCHDMPSAYAASDLIISRAGASTVSELMVVRKPALFVPYPLATGGHQTANAKVLADAGAAKIYEQRDLGDGKMTSILGELFNDPAAWQSWSAGFQRLPVDPALAAQKIAALIREVAV